jgi:hypothetical protein
MKTKKAPRPQYLPNLWYYLPNYYCKKDSFGMFMKMDRMLKQRKLSGQSFVGTVCLGPVLDSQKYGQAKWCGMWWNIQRLLVLPIDAPSPLPCDQKLSEFLQTTVAAAKQRADIALTPTEERKLKKLITLHLDKVKERGEYVRS